MARPNPLSVQRFDGRSTQPDLTCCRRIGVQRLQHIQLGWRADRQRQAAWRNHTVADFEVDALLQPDSAGLVHEHAVTGGHAHGAAVGRTHFEQLLIEWMPDDALDGPEADRAIVHAKAKYFAQW